MKPDCALTGILNEIELARAWRRQLAHRTNSLAGGFAGEAFADLWPARCKQVGWANASRSSQQISVREGEGRPKFCVKAKFGMKLCICSKILQEYEIEEALKIAKALGYEGMEIFGVPKHLPVEVGLDKVKRVANLKDELGLKVVTLCSYVGGFSELGDKECQKQYEDFKKYVEIANILDCDMVRLIPGGPPYPKDAREDHWLRSAFWLSKCADYGLGNGIRIVLENNFGLSATVDSTLKLLGLIDRPNVGVNYDPGNIYRFTPDYYGREAILRFGAKIFNVQVKDADISDKDNINLLLGEGKVDYLAIFKALKEIGYEGYLSAECHREPDAEMNAVQIAQHEFEAISSLLSRV